MIRFHLDESVARATANGLRHRGLDVTTPQDTNLIGASDEEQLAFAIAEGRVIVTHDDDFLRLARRDFEHLGIAYRHQRHRSVGQIGLSLVNLARNRTPEEMRNQIVFV